MITHFAGGLHKEIKRLTAELAVRIRDVEYWKEQAWVKPRPVDLQAVHDQVTIDTLNDAVVRLTAERDTLITSCEVWHKRYTDRCTEANDWRATKGAEIEALEYERDALRTLLTGETL